ncbi:ankyrin repeat-containing protein [Colletotrichum asianum]|uniref:Ankyrin repeat-containing protein n=1 Tax=Colletotrichum asianum TaxID=702518 RepID=A0A8H3WBZ2_9PEZI|nr:ankyrin repeat-containing protein [Colletotrichum asianum]
MASSQDHFFKLLEYWSIDNLDALSRDYGGHSESDDVKRLRLKNYPGARSYLRFLRDSSDDYDDGPSCTGAEEDSELCRGCTSRLNEVTNIEYFRVGLKDSLLRGDADDADDVDYKCANLRPNDASLWAKEPNFYRALAADGMGFLSQVAHVCMYAAVRPCTKARCTRLRERMDSRAPRVTGWSSLREWAITAMSCQENHRKDWTEKSAIGHTHIASAVAGLAMALAECSRPCYRKTHFQNHLDGAEDGEDEEDADEQVKLLDQVLDLLYWMVSVQYNFSVGPDKFGRWVSDSMSNTTGDGLERPKKAFDQLDNTRFCKFRVWNFLEACDRKDADLPTIMNFLGAMESLVDDEEQKAHENCTPKFCQQAIIDSTKTEQMHALVGDHDCFKLEFDMDQIDKAIDEGHSTAWLCGEENISGNKAQLAHPDDDYVAISHVWSDGTGVGVSSKKEEDPDSSARMVNSCLWEFWKDKVNKVWEGEDRKAIWWDAVSVPEGEKQYVKALESLHKNYANAKCTIVHDKELTRTEFKNDGSPCVALVLSNWFSRGWTALELQMSKQVKVLFRKDGEIVPYDLDKDILEFSPSTTSPAHWLATSWIKRLREPVNDIGDIIHTLNSRSTSRPRDKTRIAALLADVPHCDFSGQEGKITRDILSYLGKVPSLCLFHGEATMKNSGPWSWCPSTIFNMPAATPIDVESRTMSDFLSLLDVTEDGAISGQWRCRELKKDDDKTVHLFGRDPSSRVKVRLALQKSQTQRCLLLRPMASLQQGEPALLVKRLGQRPDHNDEQTLLCDYVGTVWETQALKESDWRYSQIIMGSKLDPDESKELEDFGDVSSEYPKYSISDEKVVVDVEDCEPQQKPDPAAWLSSENTHDYDEWPGDDESFLRVLQSSSVDERSLQEQLIDSIAKANQKAAQYLLELSKDDLDPELADQLRLKVDEGEDEVKSHAIINGLWSLGDHYLREREWNKAEEAYNSALGLFESLTEDDLSSQAHLIPSYTGAMLTYQRGLVSMLSENSSDAGSFFTRTLEMMNGRTRSQKPLNQNGTRSQGSVKKEVVNNKQQARGDRPEDRDGDYFVKRSALGALILLSIDQENSDDEPLDEPREYFMRSLRFAERDRLEGNAAKAIIDYSLGMPEDDPPSLGEEAVDIEKTLRSALKKFDVLFRKKHLLCCVTALCLGVTLRIRSLSASDSEQVRLSEDAKEHFERAAADMMEMLPDFSEEKNDSGRGMILRSIALAHKQLLENDD